EMLNHCPDVRMFGGTFSFEEKEVKEYGGALYGPVQLSYGIDLMGADIIHLKLGTPFSTEKGKQTTTAEEYGVDHAVISYDITINPRNYPGLLKQKDI
ncbi:MAG: type I CRISPR-associated protein Cas7, partial [Candidatus Korarchaeota archaeon]|nr:type I CRISPR-associated protein Cas7 [Candidatus Korarchaeota archaeon]NIU83317.1 CRISPR-associated protein [Candidatus Thorarchaeota archaeon]NIW13654.1 CRISPR-associated protein [Candidatus Thorarchaeota archaeon]NIW51755.1 CRISPR-associated protein [Candidatus Korarchaeota archaeon]